MIALLALAGCQTIPELPQPPKMVEVVVEKMVPVPPALTEPCQQPAKQANTVHEAVRLANERKAALDECSARMARIRGLTPVKKSPAKEVQVDLGEGGILVLQYKKILTPRRSAPQAQKAMEQVAATPGRQTIVLEDGVKYSVIPRELKA